MGNFSIMISGSELVRCICGIFPEIVNFEQMEKKLQTLKDQTSRLKAIRNDLNREFEKQNDKMKQWNAIKTWIKEVDNKTKEIDKLTKEIEESSFGGFCSFGFCATNRFAKKIDKELDEVICLLEDADFDTCLRMSVMMEQQRNRLKAALRNNNGDSSSNQARSEQSNPSYVVVDETKNSNDSPREEVYKLKAQGEELTVKAKLGSVKNWKNNIAAALENLSKCKEEIKSFYSQIEELARKAQLEEDEHERRTNQLEDNNVVAEERTSKCNQVEELTQKAQLKEDEHERRTKEQTDNTVVAEEKTSKCDQVEELTQKAQLEEDEHEIRTKELTDNTVVAEEKTSKCDQVEELTQKAQLEEDEPERRTKEQRENISVAEEETSKCEDEQSLEEKQSK